MTLWTTVIVRYYIHSKPYQAPLGPITILIFSTTTTERNTSDSSALVIIKHIAKQRRSNITANNFMHAECQTVIYKVPITSILN